VVKPESVALVAAQGGDYTNPLDAVANIATGDGWCRASNADPGTAPCVISVAPGVYELAATLVVPPYVSLIGYGREATVLDAKQGVRVAVQLGNPNANDGSNLGIALRDLSVYNRRGDGSTSVALATARETSLEISDVRALAAGSSSNIAVQDGENATNRYRWLQVEARGGQTSVGFQIAAGGSPVVEHCRVTAGTATMSNVGVSNDVERSQFSSRAFPRLTDCEIHASGGTNATALSSRGGATNLIIARSTLVGENAAGTNIGIESGGSENTSELVDLNVDARGQGASQNFAVALRLNPTASSEFYIGVHRLARVTAVARDGSMPIGLLLNGDHDENAPVLVVDSSILGLGFAAGARGYGVRLTQSPRQAGTRVGFTGSRVQGGQASFFYDGPEHDNVVIDLETTSLHGPLQLGPHEIRCIAVRYLNAFYAETCPPQ
jgi:hypothetical protein